MSQDPSSRRVVRRGFATVELATVERLLREHLGVAEAAAVGTSVGDGPTHVIAFVTAPPDDVDGAELRRRLSMRIALVLVPTRIEVVGDLPRTPDGRPDLEALERRASGAGRSMPALDGVAADVAALWSTALGTAVGGDDDYFRLGGDFQLAVRTGTVVERATGHRIPPSRLLTHRTPSAIAAHVASSGEDPSSTMVPIVDDGGDDPLVVFTYDMDGSAFQMADVARETGLGRVWGLDLPSMGGRADAGRSLEAVAARHVQDILAVAPDGPPVLLGYSLGAILAHEIACQLHAAGHPPALLGLIDLGPVHVSHDMGRRGIRPAETWPWRPPGTDPRAVRLTKYLRHAADLPKGARLEYLARAANLGRDWDTARAEHDLRTTGRVRPTLRRPWAWYRLMETTVDHRFGRYPGDLVVFVCDQTAKGNVPTDPRVSYASKLEPTLGWRPFVDGELRLWPVVGVHTDLIEPPYVAGLGAELRRAIDELARG